MALQAREQLYQQLLQRAIGQGDRLLGESTCHFQGCNEKFTAATTNVARACHFWHHFQENHTEKQPSQQQHCHFPGCGADLAALSDRGLRIHFRQHGRHVCPFQGCEQNLLGVRQDQIIQHLVEHFLDRCHFPGCDYEFTNGNSEDEHREHMHTHLRGAAQDGPRPIDIEQPEEPPKDEDQDNVPQRVLDQHQGMTLYCPHCLNAVTGKRKSMCRVGATIIEKK